LGAVLDVDRRRDLRFRSERAGQHCVLEVEGAQRLDHVRRHHHPCADFVDARRLLVDVYFKPAQQQRTGGSETADAAADDGDCRCACERAQIAVSPTRRKPLMSMLTSPNAEWCALRHIDKLP